MDVRPADQYSRGSFPGAVNIPLDEFDEKMEAVDKDKTDVVRLRECVACSNLINHK